MPMAERDRRRMRLALVLVGLVVIGFLVPWLRSTSDEVGSLPLEESIPEAAPSPIAARPAAWFGPRHDEEEKGTAPLAEEARPLRSYRGPLHVHGRVLGPSDVSFGADARVHLVVVVGEPRGQVVARAPLDAYGAFDFHAKADREVSRVRVVASIPGFVTSTVDAQPTAEGDVAVDVPLAETLKGGWTCRARVFDDSGEPLEGLPVLVEASPNEGACLPLGRLEESAVIGTTDGGVAEGLRGLARTDAEGRFSIRGLQCGGCSRARSRSPEWFILDDDANQWLARNRDSQEIWLTARPAGSLHLRVFDEATGAPIRRFQAHVVTEGGQEWRPLGREGQLDVTWPVDSQARAPRLDVSVRDEEQAFAPWSENLQAEPRAREITAQVPLRRLAPETTGRVLLRIAGPGARDMKPTGKLFFEVHLRRPRIRSIGMRVEAEVSMVSIPGSGVVTGPYDVPDGPWTYDIVPPDNVNLSLLGSHGSIVVPGGRETEILWSIPALGTLVLGKDESSVQLEGATVVLRSEDDGRVLRAEAAHRLLVPTGRWAVTVSGRNLEVVATGTASIAERTDSLLLLRDE